MPRQLLSSLLTSPCPPLLQQFMEFTTRYHLKLVMYNNLLMNTIQTTHEITLFQLFSRRIKFRRSTGYTAVGLSLGHCCHQDSSVTTMIQHQASVSFRLKHLERNNFFPSFFHPLIPGSRIESGGARWVTSARAVFPPPPIHYHFHPNNCPPEDYPHSFFSSPHRHSQP